MATALNSQTLGIQIERVRSIVPTLWYKSETLLNKLPTRPAYEVSSRPTRVPLDIQGGGNGGAFNPDGGNLGRGSAGARAVGLLSNAYYRWNIEWTFLSEKANDSSEKSVQNYIEKEVSLGLTNFNDFLDSLIQGNGSDSPDTVVAYNAAGPSLSVTAAARFQDQQIIQIVTGAVGGAIRGTAQISYVDYMNNQIFLTAVPTYTPAAGDAILIENASNIAGSGMAGLMSYHVSGTVGTFLTLNRANYGNRLSTPYVPGGNQPISPAYGRLLINLMRRRHGVDAGVTDGGFWYMNLDQEAAWENVGLVLTENIFQQQTGDSSVDMLKKNPPKTMAGYPIVTSNKAQPGRVDFVTKDHMFRQEIIAPDFYEIDGQTVYPIYGGDGGLSTAKISTIVWGGNLGCDDPSQGAFGDSLAIPAGY